jgi:lipopolysaccharide/colanic/teichoic acid biosynthesis glycosyltransferase
VSDQRRPGYAAVKRAIDVIGAVAGLVLTAPIAAAVAVAIRWRLGPPVLFRQWRPGRGGELFELVKFRTMRHPVGTERDVDRLTPLGRWLRRTSLDELPTLWNVLRGDMSLVGPRPLLPAYLPRYTPAQARRHEVRPGITGLAQVRGRNALSWDEKFAADLEYVDHLSLALDVRMLLATVGAVLGQRGISASESETMPEFMGSDSIEGEPAAPAAAPLLPPGRRPRSVAGGSPRLHQARGV